MLIEASDHLLGPFDARLVSYVEALLKKRKFDVRTGVRVTAVHRNDVELSSGETVPCGLVVWSTGIQPVKLMQTLAEKDTLAWSRGRLLMDDYMRVLRSSPDGKSHEVVPDVYGLGDCAVSSTNPLPTLGGIARMQAAYLAKKFNSGKLDGRFSRRHHRPNNFATRKTLTSHQRLPREDSVGVSLLGLSSLNSEQDPHSNVLVQELALRT
mmetsp:Transcript_9379/g.23009  ORF Transcript_9379/g.23009 Transcript_9379/m.23009 type:complete len:210 (+) Transcript_9379:177-806(+)